jgi:UDP-N-acetylmuramate: L-alanyl-gamma-D-glutamyl-meso-diaminopimelate ligase
LSNGQDAHLAEVLAMGCWTPVERFGVGDWEARDVNPDGSAFTVAYQGEPQGRAEWTQLGMHNVYNALAALAAARQAGVPVTRALEALRDFRGSQAATGGAWCGQRRRCLRRLCPPSHRDSHHLAGLRARVGAQPIIAVLEPRSNTMKLGVFKDSLAPALALADAVVLYQAPDLGWDLGAVAAALGARGQVCHSLDATLAAIQAQAQPGTQVLIMSNGALAGFTSGCCKRSKPLSSPEPS